MVKTILQLTVKGTSRSGRQRKRWKNIIKDWKLGESVRAVEDREGFRRHLWCPRKIRCVFDDI